jgi:hypothetical protein
MFGQFWNTVKVSDGRGPQTARNGVRAASANEATHSKLRDLMAELKVAVASKSRSGDMEPPTTAEIDQVYQIQHADPTDPTSDLVLGWGYMDAFHYLAGNGEKWKLSVLDGRLTAEPPPPPVEQA